MSRLVVRVAGSRRQVAAVAVAVDVAVVEVGLLGVCTKAADDADVDAGALGRFLHRNVGVGGVDFDGPGVNGNDPDPRSRARRVAIVTALGAVVDALQLDVAAVVERLLVVVLLDLEFSGATGDKAERDGDGNKDGGEVVHSHRSSLCLK